MYELKLKYALCWKLNNGSGIVGCLVGCWMTCGVWVAGCYGVDPGTIAAFCTQKLVD